MSPRKSRKYRSRKSRKPIFIIVFLAVVAVIIVWSSMVAKNGSSTVRVLLRTNMGDIVIELYDDMPITTGNFKNLVQHACMHAIAMANAGPNTGSSQFFINLVDNNRLDSKHPVFGKVIQGMDVVDNIAKVNTDENDRPLQEVRIIKAEIVD